MIRGLDKVELRDLLSDKLAHNIFLILHEEVDVEVANFIDDEILMTFNDRYRAPIIHSLRNQFRESNT